MEITEHQANMFRALADKKTLQAAGMEKSWFDIVSLDTFMLFINVDGGSEVRIKPDVIVVNGIEVPAPEKVTLRQGECYYLASPKHEEGYVQSRWRGDDEDKMLLRLQILHKTPEAAGAHGKAMRAHKPG